ncbi:MAG: hypothetical protein ACUVWP_07645 [bacterium]
MSDFSILVEGGIMPPRLVCHNIDGNILKTVDIPYKGYIPITESFEQVSDRYITIDGRLNVIHKGYRYRCKIKLSYLDKYTLRQIKIIHNHLKDNNYLIIYPHRDRLDIRYRVEIEEPFSFGYLSGRMIGYSGILRLIGVDLLSAIPTDYKIAYFNSVDREYEESEITHFTSSDEENYDEDEISQFCSSTIESHMIY